MLVHPIEYGWLIRYQDVCDRIDFDGNFRTVSQLVFHHPDVIHQAGDIPFACDCQSRLSKLELRFQIINILLPT